MNMCACLITASRTDFHYGVSFVCSHHAGSVKVLGVPSVPVQGQEGVGVPRRAVTQAVALLQQAVVPHHLSTLQGCVQVVRHSEGLETDEQDEHRCCQEKLNHLQHFKSAEVKNKKRLNSTTRWHCDCVNIFFFFFSKILGSMNDLL